MAGDILHFAQAFFLKFCVSFRAVTLSEPEADGQNLVHNQNLVCSPPCSRSPAGLPAAAFLHAASPSRKTLRAGGQSLGSGSKCAATANASRTYMPELYRLIRSLPLISPFRLPAAV